MEQMTIMRRADGKLFTIEVRGQEHLALWPSLESALRYKRRNPQLLVFLPAAAASPFGKQSLLPLRKENRGVFLLIDAGGAHFGDGQAISWGELDSRLSASVQPADRKAEPATPIPTSLWKMGRGRK